MIEEKVIWQEDGHESSNWVFLINVAFRLNNIETRGVGEWMIMSNLMERLARGSLKYVCIILRRRSPGFMGQMTQAILYGCIVFDNNSVAPSTIRLFGKYITRWQPRHTEPFNSESDMKIIKTAESL